MQILHVEIQDFGSHANSTLNLTDRGLILVEGPNGAGKSTIFEAICWCLFGRLSEARIKGDQVIRHEGKAACVTVLLDVNGQSVEVVRYRQHHKHKNGLHLTIGGKDSRGATDRDTQARLMTLLQLDWQSFVATTVFPQGQSGIAGWSDAEQKGVLDTLLNFERFLDARGRVVSLKQQADQRIARLVVDEELVRSGIAHRQQTISQLRERSTSFEAQKKQDVLHKRQALQAHLEIALPDARTFSKRVTALESQLADSEDKLANSDYQNNQRALEHLKSRGLDWLVQLQSLQAQLGRIECIDPDEELARAERCPSCGQELPIEAQQQLYASLMERQAAASGLSGQLVAQIAGVEKEIADLDGEIAGLTKSLQETEELRSSITSLQAQLDRARIELQQVQWRTKEWRTIQKRLKQDLEKAEIAENPFAELLETEEAALEPQQQRLFDIQREIEPLRQDSVHLDFWVRGFGNRGVKSLLLSTVTPYLNERANLYMRELTNGKAAIQIGTQTRLKSGELRDRLSFKVVYPHGSDSYVSKSGGERRRADLAILFALGDLAASRSQVPVGLSILDEPFENLDAEGCEQVVRLLRKHVLPRARTILVMSHAEDLKSLFEQRIRVMKEGGVSSIKEA